MRFHPREGLLSRFNHCWIAIFGETRARKKRSKSSEREGEIEIRNEKHSSKRTPISEKGAENNTKF